MNETTSKPAVPRVYHGGKFKKIEGGQRVMLTLPSECHTFVKRKGGSKWLTQLLRREMAIDELGG